MTEAAAAEPPSPTTRRRANTGLRLVVGAPVRAPIEASESPRGEFQPPRPLRDAAALLATQPMTLQLRYLQTLTEIGVEKNTTIVFPLPLEMMTIFNKMGEMRGPAMVAGNPEVKAEKSI